MTDTIHSCSYYCDRPECAAQTPLVDLLADVPEDATANYEESAFCSHHIPYGRLCREALAEIKKLTAERDELRRRIVQAPRGTPSLMAANAQADAQ